MGQGGGGGFSGIYESAAFANILIEFETENREMAVDVPDSFVAQTKTPPKYPPPSSLGPLPAPRQKHGKTRLIVGLSVHPRVPRGSPRGSRNSSGAPDHTKSDTLMLKGPPGAQIWSPSD